MVGSWRYRHLSSCHVKQDSLMLSSRKALQFSYVTENEYQYGQFSIFPSTCISSGTFQVVSLVPRTQKYQKRLCPAREWRIYARFNIYISVCRACEKVPFWKGKDAGQWRVVKCTAFAQTVMNEVCTVVHIILFFVVPFWVAWFFWNYFRFWGFFLHNTFCTLN